MSPAGDPGRLEVDIKQKSYRTASGGELGVLRGLTLSLAGGEVGALVGPSGCGKTTLLRIIAGLDHDYDGRIALPNHGRLGMVFQEPRLLPWRTLEQNVRLAAPQANDETLDDIVPQPGTRGASTPVSERIVARPGAARGGGAGVRGRARSAAARRAVRVARRRAGSAIARRARRARHPPSGDDAPGDAQCR